MLALDECDPYAQKDQFADGPSLRGGLLLELAKKGSGNIDDRPNDLLFHISILLQMP